MRGGSDPKAPPRADPAKGRGILGRIGGKLRSVFQGRPWLDPVVLGVLAFVGAAAVGLLGRMPVAHVHDEFAYLLMGETFASGRLTNPTPPFWEHLETFHVLMVPTYMGKYPPGQGLALAIGFLLGHPILGVWLSCAAMVAAVTWMLQAWLPRGWAAAGGALVLLQLGVVGYWAQSYWGGAVAAIGGALVYGAVRRLWERPRVAQGLLLGVGLLILANTRPMEGLVASLPVAAVLAVKLVRSKGWGDRLRLTLPTAAVLMPGFVWMGVYNHAVTGSATTMPYQEYSEQYATAPNLLFLTPREDPPEYRHPEFRQYWVEWDMARYRYLTTMSGFLTTRATKLGVQLVSILGPALLGLLVLAASVRRFWVRVALIGAMSAIGISLFSKGAYPHYVAPAAAPLTFLAMTGWRRIAALPIQRFHAPMVLSAAAVVCIVSAFARILVRSDPVTVPETLQLERAEVAHCLTDLDYPSIVLVEYEGPFQHSGSWVRNGPDPFESKVVWARSMTRSADRDAIAGVPDRAVWLVSIAATPGEPRYAGRPPLQLVRPPVTASSWEGEPPCR